MKRIGTWLCVLLVAAGCSQKKTEQETPPAPVLVGTVTQKTVPVVLRTIGNVEAMATVTLKSQVTGPVMSVEFKEGQEVKKGDLLFTIDARPFEATLKAAVAVALKTKNDLERSKRLLQEKTISQQELEDAQAAFQAADAALDQAKLNVEYCRITSPVDGRTSTRMVDVGNVVRANDLPILTTINQLSPIYVTFTLPEQSLADVRKFMAGGALKVKVNLASEKQSVDDGILTFIDNTVEKQTGTIRLKATFPNADRRLWPGLFVDVLLTLTEEPNVLTVPSEAIQAGQDGQQVFVVKADKMAELRHVKAGRTFNGETVIESGLQAGETIVVDGQLRVINGGKVEIKTGLVEK